MDLCTTKVAVAMAVVALEMGAGKAAAVLLEEGEEVDSGYEEYVCGDYVREENAHVDCVSDRRTLRKGTHCSIRMC